MEERGRRIEEEKKRLSEEDYREFLGARIEGITGTLRGERKLIWCLDTDSLERLFLALR